MVELIVEDGSVVTDANSYASVDTIAAYAASRGVTLAAGSPIDEAVAIMAINAMDYLEKFRNQYRGKRTDAAAQRLSWPRYGAIIDDDFFPDDSIPQQLIDAQCQLCIQISRGVSLLPTSGDSSFIVREKIGPLETVYSEAVRLAAGSLPVMPGVDALLADLLDGAAFGLRTVRV